jgi:hypothetical protein
MSLTATGSIVGLLVAKNDELHDPPPCAAPRPGLVDQTVNFGRIVPPVG